MKTIELQVGDRITAVYNTCYAGSWHVGKTEDTVRFVGDRYIEGYKATYARENCVLLGESTEEIEKRIRKSF